MISVKDRKQQSIIQQAKTTIYRLNEHDSYEYSNLPVNPSSLRFSDEKLDQEYRKVLYCEKTNPKLLNMDFKSALINFYAGILSLILIEVATFSFLRYNDEISSERFILVLVLAVSILAVSLMVLTGIHINSRILVNNRRGYSAIGILVIFYLVFSDERVQSGVFGNSYNEDGIQHSNLALGVFILMKFVLLDGFMYFLLVVLSYIIFSITFFTVFCTVNLVSVWNEILFVTIIGVMLVADSYSSEIRTKQLFFRNYKEEEKVKLGEYKPIIKVISEASIIENTIDVCQSIKQKLKTACKVIIFKDTKYELKQSMKELDQIMKRISQSTMLNQSPAHRLNQLEDEEAKFLEEYMNLNIHYQIPSENESSIVKEGLLPISVENSAVDLENIISSFGRNWNFDIWFLYETSGQSIFIVASHTFETWNLKNKLNIPNDAFEGFFTGLEAGYLDNPYHNACHAADVLHSFLYFIEKSFIVTELDPFDLLAVSIAALGHDIGHPGFTNRFLTAEQSELAYIYNDSSVLENMSASKVFELSKAHNLFKNFENQKYLKVRKSVIEMILETDLSRHYELLGRFKTRALNLNNFEFEIEDDKILVLAMGLKVADVSHTGKRQDLHLKWSGMIAEEFYNEGDIEKENGTAVSMFFDRESRLFNQNQASFLKNVCLPLFEVWCSYLNSDEINEHCLTEVKRNMEMWIENSEKREKSFVYMVPSPVVDNSEFKRFNLSAITIADKS